MVGMYGRLVLLNILEIPYITTVDDTDWKGLLNSVCMTTEREKNYIS
jgi:hypothetical protein